MNRIGIVLLAALATAAGADEMTTQWTFEGGTEGWEAVRESIRLEGVEGGATEESRGALHISGEIEGQWNYVRSPRFPFVGGELYRITLNLRVDRLGLRTPPPFFKCEFLPKNPRRTLGRTMSMPYDELRLGEWQEIFFEFRAPEEAVSGWIALETGTTEPVEIDAWLDDVRVERVERFRTFEQYRLERIPPALEAVRGVRPRLFLSPERLAALREAIRSTHADLWEEVRALADRVRKERPPAYRKDDGRSGDEQLWQRSVGNVIPYAALAYLLSGEPDYLRAAREWAETSARYPTWGLGNFAGSDLAAGHQLLGLALFYDWCYEDLEAPTRTLLRETLTKRANVLFEAGANGTAWWYRSYMQNHLWVNSVGLAAAGFALFDEEPDALLWIGFAADKFRRSIEALGPDGASHEGVGYWQYGVEYLLKWLHLSAELLGEDLSDDPWWRRTALYPLYLSVPRNAWTRRDVFVDLADSPRYNWYGPDYQLRRLATLARDEEDGRVGRVAQWLANAIDAADLDNPAAKWLNLIWYDPSIEPLEPSALPTLHHFDDMGIVSARSDWSGDESLVVLKSGPFIGHEAVERFRYDPGGGHVHPDANHILLFGAGEWLLLDDGYRAKETKTHNTLTIDGAGQLGEGAQWFRGGLALRYRARARIVRAESGPALDVLVGDATAAYPPESGLRRFERYVLFVKPNRLLVLDRIETDGARDLTLRFHPEGAPEPLGGGVFLARGERAVLRIEALGDRDDARLDRSVEELPAVAITARRSEWRTATAFGWGPADTTPEPVRMREEGSVWTFQLDGRLLRFDWDGGRASIEP